MIQHLSIAAREPKQAADVLAEMMGAGPWRSHPIPNPTRSRRRAPQGVREVRRALRQLDAVRAERPHRLDESERDRRACQAKMFRLQQRPVPPHRGMIRERNDDRGVAAGMCGEITGTI
jgi:hypothetical protein